MTKSNTHTRVHHTVSIHHKVLGDTQRQSEEDSSIRQVRVNSQVLQVTPHIVGRVAYSTGTRTLSYQGSKQILGSTFLQEFGLVFLQVTSDLRLLKSRVTIATVRIDTIDARSVRSTCVHAAILNISVLTEMEEDTQWLRSVFQT